MYFVKLYPNISDYQCSTILRKHKNETFHLPYVKLYFNILKSLPFQTPVSSSLDDLMDNTQSIQYIW